MKTCRIIETRLYCVVFYRDDMQKGGDACGEATQPPRLQESPGAVVGGRPLPPPPAPALHPAHHHRPRHPRRLRGQGTFIRTRRA